MNMKKLVVLLVSIIFIFSGCAFHQSLTANLNNHTTEVVLSKNNFEVVKRVQGESKALYVLGIGGLSEEAMVAKARANMMSKADMVGSSKAIINETFEIKHSFFPLIRQYKVTVSGHVVKFTD